MRLLASVKNTGRELFLAFAGILGAIWSEFGI